ncbi:MAG: glycosyltransferase [Mycoplasmataceae bacterium]|nr:glycosyltransferase [Mycoplasmataceae bacterium]
MKFSIIIPVYNSQINYLSECLISIQNQTYKDFELIFINDGFLSNEMNEYIHTITDINIKLINNPSNIGLGPSRNIGIKHASGEYIVFCDDDDFLVSNALEVMEYYLQQFPNLNLLSFNCLWSINNKIVKPVNTKDGWNAYELTNVNKNHNIFKKSPTSWSNCYQREFLIKNNIFYLDSRLYGEDLYFHILVFSKAKSIYVIDEPLYVYRRDNVNSLSNTHDIKDKTIGLLHYATEAFQAIKKDESLVSNHYAIFFKFLWENYIAKDNLGDELKKQKEYPMIHEKYQKMYEWLKQNNY